MGLTSWAGTQPRKTDATIAKNYLTADELEALNRIVTAYLEFAELQALNRKPMTMAAWISKLDDFLRLSDRDILTDAGKISHDQAVAKAAAEFNSFRQSQAALPQPVDRDLEQTLERLQTLESEAKTLSNAAPKKRSTKKKPKSPG